MTSRRLTPLKALVKEKPEPGIWMADQPIPAVGPDDVLVRVHRTGICGTDVHIYRWDEWASRTIPVPMVVGHEFAGEVVEIGSAVRGISIGMRVSGEGHVIGQRSRASRAGKFHLDPETRGIGVQMPGAFAEYVRLPAFNAVVLPDEVDDELGAILDPLGNAVHTALSFDLVGEDVLITGAGPIGIMAAAIARHVGARHVVITDVNQTRLDLAARVADCTPVNVATDDLKAVSDRLRMREGFDVAFEMSGTQAGFETATGNLLMGGRLAMLGLPARPFPVDWSRLVFKMVTIKCIYGREMFETWHKMLAMLQSGLDVRGVITHRFPASEYARGFELMDRGACGKVVLDWSGGPE